MTSGILICILILIYIPSVVESYHNLTLNAVASQSSTLILNGVRWSADKAIDGCFNESHCSAGTMNEKQNWIRIDLRNVFKIKAVEIVFVTENSYGLSVDMSMTKDLQHCINANLSYNGLRYTISSKNRGPLPESRFITLRRKEFSIMLKEILVYGGCPENYCGASCTELCFCRNPIPSRENLTGQICDGGCLIGWTGERCNTSFCPAGKFGYRCLYSCHCREQCDPWTGECLGTDRTCTMGWSGPSCQLLNTFPYKMYTYDNEVTDEDINTCVDAPKSEIFVITLPRERILNHALITVKQESYKDIELYLLPKKEQNNCKPYPMGANGCSGMNRLLFLCHESDIQALDFRNIRGSICEIQLFACAARSFGPDCHSRCHCMADYCNNVDGSCLGDGTCLPGWKGKACNEPCFHGFYGDQCSLICDRCANNKTCHPETGICPDGMENTTTELISTAKTFYESDPKDQIVMIILSASGGLIALVALLTTVIILIHRRKNKKPPRQHESVDENELDCPTDARDDNLAAQQTGASYDDIIPVEPPRISQSAVAGVLYVSEPLVQGSDGTYDVISEERLKMAARAEVGAAVGGAYEALLQRRTDFAYDSLHGQRNAASYIEFLTDDRQPMTGVEQETVGAICNQYEDLSKHRSEAKYDAVFEERSGTADCATSNDEKGKACRYISI